MISKVYTHMTYKKQHGTAQIYQVTPQECPFFAETNRFGAMLEVVCVLTYTRHSLLVLDYQHDIIRSILIIISLMIDIFIRIHMYSYVIIHIQVQQTLNTALFTSCRLC